MEAICYCYCCCVYNYCINYYCNANSSHPLLYKSRYDTNNVIIAALKYIPIIYIGCFQKSSQYDICTSSEECSETKYVIVM